MTKLQVKTIEGDFICDYILSENGELLLRIENYGTANFYPLEDIIMIRPVKE